MDHKAKIKEELCSIAIVVPEAQTKSPKIWEGTKNRLCKLWCVNSDLDRDQYVRDKILPINL